MSSKAVYILGGMGPQASGELYRILIEKAHTDFGAINNVDYPEIVLHSIPVPDFISSSKEKERAKSMLIEVIEHMDDERVGVFGIACNTAHLLQDELIDRTTVKFISMIDAVARRVAQKHVQTVGIMGSPMTLSAGLYQDSCSGQRIESLLPEINQIDRIEGSIRAVLAGEAGASDTQTILDIADTLVNKGAKCCVLGCTELPLLVSEEQKKSHKLVSSLDVFADELLWYYYKN